MRRCFLLSAAFVAAFCLVPTARAGEVVFASWGGAYADAVRDAWITPFTKKTGISVIEDTGPSLAKIKVMVQTGSVSWDVVGTSGVSFVLGVQQGLFEPVPADLVDQSHIIPGARSPYGVPSEIFGTLIGYSRQAFPAHPPERFADFWDVQRFPGGRILPARPVTVLEAALVADGVPVANVYRVLSTSAGLDRALNKIRQIRPSVVLWWNSAAQPVQALASGDAVMALGWNGRFQDGEDAGLPIGVSWAQSILQVGYFLLLKGAPDRKEALDFMRYIASAEAQARLSRFISYGPVRTDVFGQIAPAIQAHLPSSPEHLRDALFVDNAWWAEHGQDATERYTSVMQGN